MNLKCRLLEKSSNAAESVICKAMKKHSLENSIQFLHSLIVDFIVVFFSILFSYKLYRVLEIGQNVYYKKIDIIPISLVASAFVIFILVISGAYDRDSGVLNAKEIEKTIKGVTVSFLVLTLIFYFGKFNFSRYVVAISYIVSLFLIVFEKLYIYSSNPLNFLIRQRQKRALIYGAGDLGVTLFRHIMNSPRLNINPIGFIDDNREKKGQNIRSSGFSKGIYTIPVLGDLSDIEKIARTQKITDIFYAISDVNNNEFSKKNAELKSHNLKVHFVPSFHNQLIHKIDISLIGELPIVSESYDEHIKLEYYLKAFVDLFGSIVLLLALLPVLIVVSVLIKLDSKGPVFFRQERIGKDGTKFEMFKFRSMYSDVNPYAVNPISSSDNRITKVGKFLRKTSLDELPQLLNVLKGDMSLVGPRPEMEFIVNQYNDKHRERLKVKPGITGLWQLSGDREVAIHENMEYDLFYVKKWSFFLDIAILFKTIIFAFKGK